MILKRETDHKDDKNTILTRAITESSSSEAKWHAHHQKETEWNLTLHTNNTTGTFAAYKKANDVLNYKHKILSSYTQNTQY